MYNLIQTNIFPILNLEGLTASYRVYRIRGLQVDHAEYFFKIDRPSLSE